MVGIISGGGRTPFETITADFFHVIHRNAEPAPLIGPQANGRE
jgi:hypothetical protein